MGNLKDELLKKGLTDDRRARQMAHDEKARRNRLGKDAVEGERRAHEQELQAKEQARRETDRRREQERQKQEAARATRLGLAQMLRDRALTSGVRGPRRWHFVTRERRIPYLDVSDDAARRLEQGQIAICEVPDTAPEQFVLVPAEAAARLREGAPEYVLFLNPPGGGERRAPRD